MAEAPTPSQQPFFNDPLLNMHFLSPEEKTKWETGKGIAKAFYSIQTNNDSSLNFFKARNAKWIEVLLWMKGSQPMKEFMDYLSVSDGNKSYVNMDWTPTRIAAQFIGVLVESMAKNKTYVCVNAIDDGSLTEKEQRMMDALFRMHEVETINQVQEEFQVEVEPPNAYVPDDEISARVYFELEDRLPKEIRFEKIIEKIQGEIHFEKVVNRKGLYDLITTNLEATKIEKVAPGKYIPRKCVPTNMVYNFFINDNGDCEVTQIGEFYGLKVKDIRSRFGKNEERPNGLTEKQIFELAKLSSHKSIGVFNYVWNDSWAMLNNNTLFNQNRPYDDCNILVMDFEVNVGEDLYYVEKTDNFGKTNIVKKKANPGVQKTKEGAIISQEMAPGTSVIKRKKNTWMRGVYAPYGDTMLFWGEPDLIITPYTDFYKPLSSYTITYANNDGEYVPSLAERMMEPLREYQLTKLKRKQLIAQVRPSGFRIDVESARNIDLGSGNTIAWEEVLRIYNQTGTEVWSSKGIDPLQQQQPAITNAPNDPSVQKIIELTGILNAIVVEIRELIGVPKYRDGSDVGDRTSGVLQEQQNISSFNVTDFILNGHNQVWEETFYKICLLHWNDIVKKEPETKEDLLNTRFDVEVKFKSTEYQKQLLERDIDRYSQTIDKDGNPLLSPKDAMLLREIDNFKLAQWVLTSTVAKNKREAEERSARLQEQNGKIQQDSLMAKAKADQEALDMKINGEKDLKEFQATKDKELELLKGFMQVASKDETGTMIKMFLPAIQQLVPNITIPLMKENEQMVQQAQQEEMQKQMMEEAAMQQQEQGQMQPEMEMQEQPQPQMQ